MTSVSPLQHDILYDALHAFQGNPCGVIGALHGIRVHDDAGDEHVFVPLVLVHCTSLSDIEGKSEVPAADFLDPRQSRCEYVWDDHRFRQGNPVAVSHDFFLPKNGPFHRGDSAKIFLNHANQNNCEPGYVIAALTSSIPAPRKGFSQINDKLSCGFGGKNKSADDAPFPSGTVRSGNLSPSDDPDYAIDWFYFDAGSETIGRDQRLSDGSRLVSFSHGGAPS